MQQDCFRYVLSALAISLGSACATRPLLANPNVPAELGVVMGRVQIFADGRDVTQSCTVGLSKGAGREVLVRPDASGWVFAAMPQGEARISSVDCDAKSFTMGLEFDVPGDGRTTYFGHVRLDLHHETRSTVSSTNATAIGQGMRAAPPTVQGAAVATAVGVVAMALLSDSVAAAPPTAEVDDKTYEASAAYHSRYGKAPKALVVALAGSSFSSDASLSPAVQKSGDVIYTEASFGGVRLTWLAVSNQQGKAALRVQRFVRQGAPCSSMKLVLDGRDRTVPTVSKAERASAAFKQTVQGELDLQALREVASAKDVIVDVCGTARSFSALARGATINFANAYQEVVTSMRPAPPATPTAAEAETPGTPPVTPGSAPTATNAAAPAPAPPGGSGEPRPDDPEAQ